MIRTQECDWGWYQLCLVRAQVLSLTYNHTRLDGPTWSRAPASMGRGSLCALHLAVSSDQANTLNIVELYREGCRTPRGRGEKRLTAGTDIDEKAVRDIDDRFRRSHSKSDSSIGITLHSNGG